MYYVYVLECSNGIPYVGCTNDLHDRMKRHKNRNVAATRHRLPIKLICYIGFIDKYKAFEFEKYLKSGSGSAFLNKHLV